MERRTIALHRLLISTVLLTALIASPLPAAAQLVASAAEAARVAGADGIGPVPDLPASLVDRSSLLVQAEL